MGGGGVRVENTKWQFRIPRRYAWEAVKWINEKEKSGREKRSGEKERGGEKC